MIDQLITRAHQLFHATLVTLFVPAVAVGVYLNSLYNAFALVPDLPGTREVLGVDSGSVSCGKNPGQIYDIDPNYSNRGITFSSVAAHNGCSLCILIVQEQAPQVDFQHSRRGDWDDCVGLCSETG